MGGHIAGMYSITHPDDLRSVILMCPHGIKNKHEEPSSKNGWKQVNLCCCQTPGTPFMKC